MRLTFSEIDWDQLIRLFLAVFFLTVVGIGSALGAAYVGTLVLFELLGGLQ